MKKKVKMCRCGRRVLACILSFATLLAVSPLAASAAGTSGPEEDQNHALQINAGQKGNKVDYAWAKLILPEDKQVDGAYTISYDYRNLAAKNGRINYTLWKAEGTAGGLIGPSKIYDFGMNGNDNYTVRYNGVAIYPVADLSVWNHMEYRVNGGAFEFYINGTKITDSSFDPTSSGKLKTLLLGGAYEGTGGIGQFDNFKITKDGKDVYSQDFEQATLDSLEKEGWKFAQAGSGLSSVVQADPVKKPSTEKGSLQISRNNNKPGWARKDNLGIKSNQYSISFDYKNVVAPTAADSSNCFFQVAEFSQDGLMKNLIKNNSEGLQFMLGSKRADLMMNMKKWNHFDIDVDGSKVEISVNGKVCFTGTSSSTDIPTQFGWIGDGDAEGTYWDGSSLYDNFVVKDSGKVIYQQNFDGETIAQLQSEGWYFASADAMAVSGMDASDKDGLSSLTLKAQQNIFTKGITVKAADFLKASAEMSDGTAVTDDKMAVSYTSSNPAIAEVTQADNVPAFHFKTAGSVTITASLTLDGITKTASVPINVIDSAEPLLLIVPENDTVLAVGGTMKLSPSVSLSDMTTHTLSEDEIRESKLTAVSSDPSTVSADGMNLKALKTGKVTITVSGVWSGKTLKQSFTISVVAMQSVHALILSTNLYQGDQVTVAARGVLSDGSETDLTSKASFSAENASVKTEDGKTFLVCNTVGTVKLTATYGGLSDTAEAEIKAVNPVKTRASYYTEERVKNLRTNADTYSWGQNGKSVAVTTAEKWLSEYPTDAALRSVVPSQDIGRTFGVNPDGCLVCGRAVINSDGNYPYTWDTSKEDWKITCPYCGMQFPTNDFAAYYKNGLNEVGDFDAKLAKSRNNELIAKGEKGNLVNLYAVNGLPEETEEKVRKELTEAKTSNGARMYTDNQIEQTIHSIKTDLSWGVDDGMGYNWDGTDTEKYGNPYTFVGYYAHFAIWHGNSSIVYGMIHDFAQAYLYTGAQKYADAAIILLDRVADEYPNMHLSAYPHNGYYGFTNSDGHNTPKSLGRLVGSIWDNTDSKNFLYSYDAIYPAIATMSDSTREFLAKASGNPQESNSSRLKVHFEDGIIREIEKAFCDGDLSANPGAPQTTLAVAAVIMDHYPETQEWLNLDYAPGDCDYTTPKEKRTGNILGVLDNDVDPDGQGYECSLGYNSGWTNSWIEVADVLDEYQLPKDSAGKEHLLNLPAGTSSDLYLNSRFRKMLLSDCNYLLTNEYIPNIGDTGATAKPDTSILDPDLLLKAYDRLTSLDPTGGAKGDYDVLAQTLYLLNSKSSSNLHTSIMSADPMAAAKKIQAVVNSKGELNLSSQNFASFGLGILRDGVDKTSAAYRGKDLFFPSLKKSYADGASNDNFKGLDQIDPNGKVGASVSYQFDLSGMDSSYQLYLKIHNYPGGWGKWGLTLNGKNLGTVDFGSTERQAGTNLIKIADVSGLQRTGNTLTFTCEGGSGNMKMGVYDLYLLEAGKTMPPLGIKSDTTQRALWMFYGSAGSSHGHADPLNLGYIGYNLDLLPDLGYPNTAGSGNSDAKIMENSNMAHNTVSFSTATDNTYYKHYRNYGYIDHFDGSNKNVQIISANTPGVINGGVSFADLFQRTSALIRIDDQNSYIVDLFRVKGKNSSQEYQYNLHTMEIDKAKTVLSGLSSAKQVAPSNGYQPETMQNVYQYTKNGSSFSVDWNVKDTWNQYKGGDSADTNVHLKVTMLNAGDYSRVMLGEIVPPQNYTKVLSLQNLMVTGKGATTFTTVLEPYEEQSNIASIEPLTVTKDGKTADSQKVRAIKVVLKNGRTDYIVNSLDTDSTYRVADKFDFKGFFGVYSEKDGKAVQTYLLDGSQIGSTQAQASVTGKVTGMTDTLTAENYIDIKSENEVNPTDLVGKYIYVDNSDVFDLNRTASDPSGYDHKKSGRFVYNATYCILGAQKLADGTIRLNIGDTSTVRGVTDDGVTAIKNFNINSAFRIPLNVYKEEQQPTTHKLTVSAEKGGKLVSNSDGNYAAGTKITLEAAAEDGYQFKGWVCSSGTLTDAGKLTASFTMPDADATVTAQFEKTADHITVTQPKEGGTISVSPSNASTGDQVTVVASPGKGYKLKDILVNGKAISGNTFTMPDDNVTVTAEFEAIPAVETGKTKTSENAKTEDSSNLPLWISVLLISGAGIAVLAGYKRKKKICSK